MGSYFNEKFMATEHHEDGLLDYLAIANDRSRSNLIRWQYINAFYRPGLKLRGVVTSYYDYVREHIFKPAGNGNTILTNGT